MEDLGDKSGIASSYNNIGGAYEKQGNYPKALENFSDCLKISQDIGDKNIIATSYNNLGIVYDAQADIIVLDKKKERDSLFNNALVNHFEALKIRMEIGDKSGTATSYLNIGAINIKLKKFAESKKYLNDALLLSIEIGYKEIIGESYNFLSILDNEEGNFKKAYEDYKMYIVYRDSLVNEENLKKTVQMQTRYEFEKEQIIKEHEEELKIKNEKLRIDRRNVLQYTIIFLFILVVLGVVLSLGFIKVSERVAQGLIFVSLLLLFEFLLVFLDPHLDKFTKGVPLYKLIVNVTLATFIFPVHSFLEKRFRIRAKNLK